VSRGKTRDPEATRAAILAAALTEFAEHGLGGARVDDIALRAQLDKKLLYYYFGNKDELFTAVLEQAYAHIRSRERHLALDEVDPVEAIRRLVAFTWNYYLEHPEFLRLLNTENQYRAEHVKKSVSIKTMHSPFIALIETILDRGRKQGVFRSGIDPVQLYISIAGLAWFYIGNSYTLSAYFSRDLLKPKARVERLSHMTDLILAYLIA
jgi:AcrR family transcriptional regulator